MFGGLPMTTKGTFQGAFDKGGCTIGTDFGQEWFKVATYAGKIGRDRF